MEEESEKPSDQNPEDLQGISELRAKLEEDRRASEEMDVTIRRQRRRISNLKREEQLLLAQNEAIDKDIQQKEKERREMSCFLSGSQVANMMNTERAKFLKQQRALQEQVEQYRLALDSCSQDLDKRRMDIEQLEVKSEEFLTVIQELRTKNNDLEVKIFVELAFQQLVQKPLLVIPEEEEEQIAPEVEEDKEQEPSLEVDLQTKSWWRRQAESLWKVVKGMGTFCLGIMRCQGLRKCMRKVFRSNQVHPICDDMVPV